MDLLTEHWLDVLGWGGSALLVFSLMQQRVLRFRVLNLAAGVALLVFNAIIEVWPMVGLNAVTSAINIWFLVRLVGERHDEHVFEVLEVGADDAYLHHVLRTHRSDIEAIGRQRVVAGNAHDASPVVQRRAVIKASRASRKPWSGTASTISAAKAWPSIVRACSVPTPRERR